MIEPLSPTPPPPLTPSFNSMSEILNYLGKARQHPDNVPPEVLTFYSIIAADDIAAKECIKEPEQPKSSDFFNQVRKTMKDVHEYQLQRMMKKIKRTIAQNAEIGNSSAIAQSDKNSLVIKQMCNQLEAEGFKVSFSRDYNTANWWNIHISWDNA